MMNKQMDSLLADLLGVSSEHIDQWVTPGRYVSGSEFAEAGLAELIDLVALAKADRTD